MASSIKPTKRTAVPILVRLTGHPADKLVPSDPETKMVDVIAAFKLVLGDQTAHRAVNKLLTNLKSNLAQEARLDEDTIDLSKFSRVRWAGNKGPESIVAPMHTVLQALMMHNSKKTRKVREVAAKTTLRHLGGDETLAPETQRNAERLANSQERDVLLSDTGSAQAPAPIVTHTPVAAPVTGGPLALVDRLPDGPERTAMIVREHEHEMKMRELQFDRQFEVDEKRKDAEFIASEQRKNAAHRAMMAEHQVNEERRIVAHEAALAEIGERRLHNRQRSEAELSRINEEIRDSKLKQIRARLDVCTDDHMRAYLQGAYALVSQASTDFKYAIDSQTPGAPVPLTQAVLGTGSGSIGELQLPTRFNVLNALTDQFVTVQGFVQSCYPSVKLTDAQKTELGKRVGNTYDRACSGRPVRAYSTVPGAAYAARSYPIMALLEPPLKDLIENFMRNPPATAQAGAKRKATGPAPGAGPTTRRAAGGGMDAYVTVQGVPV